ncbi:transcriptional regulator [Hydrogenispora ethanolica]|jgi:transcriptional regulator CtsR|uniref:Transcriptional regulator n=1 Tax=Hydrogenispora ethanolica TaxID=1082276 RepID=A0A4R1R8I3_HYDET|nr:CtsR family transcriptional regulator [Hydrogenispora ethanolica]TCL61975.1 transcriptional regulator [Hydrogenispora ethanolica]
MGNLADFIEQYLRRMLEAQSIVELQRRELAKMFRCAPSQINYVLETRFTLERGYLIESKRGGGGFIRITQVKWESDDNLPATIEQLIPEQVGAAEVEHLLYRLADHQLIGAAEAQLAQSLIERNFSDLPPEIAGSLRSRFLKMLLMVLGSKFQK